ncbi:hypothetical protein LCGC14_2328100, partial [marine sediment metagenome]
SDASTVLHQQLAATYFMGGLVTISLGGVIIAVDRVRGQATSKKKKRE